MLLRFPVRSLSLALCFVWSSLVIPCRGFAAQEPADIPLAMSPAVLPCLGDCPVVPCVSVQFVSLCVLCVLCV